MTKRTIFIILFLTFYVFANSQTDVEKNLRRYWYYRDRLEKELMIVGSPEKAGTNWPFLGKNSWSMKVINIGENPTQDFGTYLCVLATEYRLLKDYNQNTKANETLQKLAWALESFDRVDLNCEKYLRYRLESGLPANYSLFWQKINDYRKPSDLNGCFLRGDFDGPEVYINDDGSIYTPLDTWHFRDSVGSYPSNPEANILTYNNNQLQNNNCYGLRQVGCRINGPRYPDGTDKKQKYCVIDATHSTVMSQDEVWGLLMGFAFTVKFVDDSKTFLDLEGNYVTVKDWAQNITKRIINFMKDKHDHDSYISDKSTFENLIWTLAVPVDDSHNYAIHHGGVVPLSYLFAQAGGVIAYNNPYKFLDGRALAAKPLYNYMSSFSFVSSQLKHHLPNNVLPTLVPFLPSIPTGIWLSSIERQIGSPYSLLNLQLITKNKGFDYYFRLYEDSRDYYNTTAYERLPVVYSVLHDEPLQMMWPKKYRRYKNDYLNTLSKASDCGPWAIDKDGVTQALSSKEWIKNRWEDNSPEQRLISEMDYETGQSNGLDYMILHNLYWLGFLDENLNDYEESVVVNHDYPWWWYGTDSNPKVIKGSTITSNKVVESNGNLTLIASESVTLNEGFDAKEGAFFEAYLKPTYKYISYDPNCPCFFDRPEFDKDYVSKDTIINTGIIAENKTEEKNENISFLENDKLTEKVIISPNPFNNQLFIYSTGEINKNTFVQIYNNLGVLVFEENNINNFETINTSNFSKGLYIVRVNNANKILTYKIIKQ